MAGLAALLIIVPLIWGYQLIRSPIRWIENLCDRHPRLAAKSTVSALIGGIFGYLYGADLVLTIQFTGAGVITGALLHLIDLLLDRLP